MFDVDNPENSVPIDSSEIHKKIKISSQCKAAKL